MTSTSDYTTTITGGKKYYLHIGYFKDEYNSTNLDTFIIHSINFKTDNLAKKYINFYEYKKSANVVTFTLKEDMEHKIYIRAVYSDDSTSKYGDKIEIKIDKTAPIIKNVNPVITSKDEAKVEIKVTEYGAGLKGYYLSQNQDLPIGDSEWIQQTTNEFTIEGLKTGTTYYLWAIDNVGNLSEKQEIIIKEVNYSVDDKIMTETLAEAISVANDDSIIQLLNDYTDTSVVNFNKNITFDIQNFILTRNVTITVEEEKNLEIIGTGKITTVTNKIDTVTNFGRVEVYNQVIIENLAETEFVSIRNNGIIEINDKAQIIGKQIGIYNQNGTINVKGGTIEATNISNTAYGIYNNAEENGNVLINEGEIKGYYGIYNGKTSTIEMTGGKVIGTGAYGIYAYGITNIYGGRIEGKTYGIYGYVNNRITLGKEEQTLSTTNPAIYGGTYGIGMNDVNYSFNFYNGVIITNTRETAYNSTVNLRTDYIPYTYFEEEDNKYHTILLKVLDVIEMKAEPTEFTNKDVTVTITYPYNNDIKQYSEDGKIWTNTENYIQKVKVTENKIIYARTINTSGNIVVENQIQIDNIDKEKPVITVTPMQANYVVTSSNGTTDISITIKASDTGVSGLDKVQYAWGIEGEEITYTDFNSNGTIITKKDLSIGQYYLYFYVTDKAGNQSDLRKIRYNVRFGEPVCQIGNITYTTVQAAVNTCSKSAGNTQTTITMLQSTDEEFSTYAGQNIKLDLKGYTIGSSRIDKPVCENKGTLQIIDTSTNKTGKIESLNGIAIKNTGTYVLGDSNTSIEMEVPTIYGYKIGIENEHIFNFYDGKIQGITPIKGKVTTTPEEYGPVSTTYENEITTVQLGIITQYEARIEWVYYIKVQEAIDATKKYNNENKDTVTILKNIQIKDTLEIDETKDFILDLDGYIFTLASDAQDNKVINNFGDLTITDSSEEQTGAISVKVTSDNYVIYNNDKGNVTIAKGNISSESTSNITSYGIYNASSGNITIENGSIQVNNAGKAYGIYNANIGKVTVENTNINIEATYSLEKYGYGIYNENGGVAYFSGGNIVIENTYNAYGIYNSSNSTLEKTGGSITINDDFYRGYGIYNNGIMNSTGGDISINSSYATLRVYGIYNDTQGKIDILDGTITGSNRDGTLYGVYNNGRLIVKGGTVEITYYYSSSSSCAIYNLNSAYLEIKGGTIISNAKLDLVGNCIINEGNAIIQEGIINSTNIGRENSDRHCYGISNTGTLQLGSLEDITTEKLIITSTSSNAHGIGIKNDLGIVQFYNGMIRGSKKAIVGGITEIREGYQIENQTIENKDCVFLKEKTTEKIVQIGSVQYDSLQEAINSIPENQKETIQVLKDFELKETIKFDKDIILDLNGKVITNKLVRIENIGNLEITDTTEEKLGEIRAISAGIGIYNTNKGYLKLSNGTVSYSENYALNNNPAIYNTGIGTVEMIGGKIDCKMSYDGFSIGVFNVSQGNCIMTGGEILSEDTGIRNEENSTLTISGGTIQGNDYGIDNTDTSQVIMNGGTIKSGIYGIYSISSVTVTITAGDVIVEGDAARTGIYSVNSSILKMMGGNIIVKSDSPSTEGKGIHNGAECIIEGGTINSTGIGKTYGIYNTGSTTIGIKGDGKISQTSPYIKAEYTGTSTRYFGYGIYNTTNEFNFYDGKIEGTTKALYDSITDFEANTELEYNEDETVLTLTTNIKPLAQIGTKTYNTLEEAINAVGNTKTSIKLLRNVQYPQSAKTIIIPTNKNITLDLNGYIISSAKIDRVIENNGALEITDTSTEKTGTITTIAEETIKNNQGAELLITGGLIKNNKRSLIFNEGTLKMTGGILTILNNYSVDRYLIHNRGKVELTGGEFSTSGSVSSNYYVIYNIDNGSIKFSEGTIHVRSWCRHL